MTPEFKVMVTERGWEASAYIPGLGSGDLEVTLEGSRLRIIGKQSDSAHQFEHIIEVPTGFDEAKAQANYVRSELRVVVPKLHSSRIDFWK